jgi:hypothetical protein
MYASLVAAAGYLPMTLTGEDYLELLPVEWRQVNAYGVRIGYRTYDSPELGPWRLQHSGVTARRGLWEVHHDPYDVTRVFVRTQQGWVTAPWTHLPMVSAPFAEFTWRHARKLAEQRGLDNTNETAVAGVLDDLLTRAQAGPVDRATDRVAARTRVAAASHRPAWEPDPGRDTDQPATTTSAGSEPAAAGKATGSSMLHDPLLNWGFVVGAESQESQSGLRFGQARTDESPPCCLDVLPAGELRLPAVVGLRPPAWRLAGRGSSLGR